jgi:hypothetical protein
LALFWRASLRFRTSARTEISLLLGEVLSDNVNAVEMMNAPAEQWQVAVSSLAPGSGVAVA